MEDEETKHAITDLAVKVDKKIDELSKSTEQLLGKERGNAEGKINEKPLAYMAGAFIGGAIVGYVMSRGK